MLKRVHFITLLLFWGVIALFSLGSLLGKDADFSENENRVLARRPSFSLRAITDGSFQKGWEDYLQDHVPGRDVWSGFHAAAVLASGDAENGGAYAGADGFIFEKITENDVDDERFKRNIEALRAFMRRQEERLGRGSVSALIVPTAGLVYEDKMPKGAPRFDERRRLEIALEELADFSPVDLAKVFEEKRKGQDPYGELYYHTDHHWTSHGAYVAYAAWNEEAISEEKWRVTRVSERFRGSLYSRLLSPNAFWDTIERYDSPKDGGRFVVESEQGSRGLYDEEKLQEKDKYAYFLGGNEAVLTIRRESQGEEENRKRLVIIKDSFANAFVPFVAGDYGRVTMVDLRYFNGDVDALIEKEGASEVLVLDNLSNFITDRTIGRLYAM